MSNLKRERTLIERLQSRIDLRANEIAYTEGFEDKGTLYKLRHVQAFDKRLIGRLIELEGHLSHAYRLLGDSTEEWLQDSLNHQMLFDIVLKENAMLRERLLDSGVGVVWQD